MNSQFESCTAQTILNDFRADDFDALLRLRYFVCDLHKAKLIEMHPQNEMLSDPSIKILPADFEDDYLVLALLGTDLNDQDLQRIALLDHHQHTNVACWNLSLLLLEQISIRKMGALAIQVLILKHQEVDWTRQDVALNIQNCSKLHEKIIETNVQNYLISLDQLGPFSYDHDSPIMLYLLKQYLIQNDNVAGYIQSILTKVYRHHNDVVLQDSLEEQAESFYIILYYVEQIRQEAAQNEIQHDVAFANRLEQQILEYMLLPCREKKRTIYQIQQECSQFIEQNSPLFERLFDAIYQLLNRVIHTTNYKFGTNLQFFKISTYSLVQNNVAVLSELSI